MRGRVVVADRGGVDKKNRAGFSARPDGIDKDDMAGDEPAQRTREIFGHGAGLKEPHG